MNEIIKTGLLKPACTVALVVGSSLVVLAQTGSPRATVEPGQKKTTEQQIEQQVKQQVQKQVSTATKATPVIVENKPAAPQVVTILHRLTGVELLDRLMSKDGVETIVGLGPEFKLAQEIHTNVVAGVALNGGEIIAAWLPEIRVALPTPAPTVIVKPRTARPGSSPAPEAPTPPAPPQPPMVDFPRMNFPASFFRPADLNVIMSDGKRVVARYIGIDGLTGLSLIAMPNGRLSQANDAKDDKIVVGQKIRIIGPQPATDVEANAKGPMYIRIGETEAIVVNVTRSPSGGIARVKIRSQRFSPANIGSIAVNDANETLGIVDGFEGGQATIVPLNLMRMAAKRVAARQASVPRPWLGIRGEPVSAMAFEKLVSVGWEAEKARALSQKQHGLMLTSVVPGSPAALANLKAGDVILAVNDGWIRNTQEFSWLLDEATPENPVRFTIAKPGKEAPEPMEIKLAESPDPFFGWPGYERRIKTPRPPRMPSFHMDGIRAVALRPNVATRFGSNGGLLVVSVEPETDAFKAGLRPGDLIETINGQPVYNGNAISVSVTPGARNTCTVVRNKEKITLTFKYHDDDKDDDKDEKP